MTGRYGLSSQRWALIEDIVSPPRSMGHPRRDDRQMLNGIFWILCSGAEWRDLPERYGPWKTVYQRWYQDSHALRCQWLSAELYPLAWSAGRFAQLYSVTGSGASFRLSGQTTQALPDSDRRQGLR